MASAAVLLLVLIINVAGGVVGVYAAQCGRDAGGAVCDGGLCCSAWGFCGNESAWCGEGCQSGPCIGTSPPPPAAQCGRDAGGAVCDGGLCCSAWGFCGSESAWCGDGCQSGPCIATTPPPPPAIATPPPPAGPGVGSIITESLFNEMLKHTDNPACPARGFYTYDAFIEATKSFPHFGTTGNDTTQRRELAAFFAQTSHETTGGWETAPDGPYAWGYCFVREVGGGTYCAQSSLWPCVQGRQYYGRGPIQLSWNYNYGQAGEALGFDGLGNPDIVETDRLIAFKTALWFWMTTQPPKPSCHDVITGVWTPSPSDIAAGRVAGFGLTTNIINGGLECGIGPDPRQKSRMGFYRRYLEILGVSDEYNLDCNTQTPYGLALSSHPHHLLLRTLV